jgi:hypothetical protein
VTSWRRAPSALWRDTLDSTVVLADDVEPVRLRGTARPLWHALAEGGTATALATRVAGTADSDVVADLEQALEALEDAGAVVRG